MVDLTAWRDARRIREEGKEVRLPSGRSAFLRPIGFELLLMRNAIPDALTAVVIEIMDGRRVGIPFETTQQRIELLQFADNVAGQMFVLPKIVANPQAEDEVAVEDVPLEDKLYLLNLIGGGAVALSDFRPQQSQNVDSVDTSTGTQETRE